MLSIIRTIRNKVVRINPQYPGDSFQFQRTALLWVDMWPPIDAWNEATHFLTNNKQFYSVFRVNLLGCFMYASIALQAIDFLKVDNIGDLVAGLFILMTQVCGAFKVLRFIVQYKKFRFEKC
jgi:hypothetical protein